MERRIACAAVLFLALLLVGISPVRALWFEDGVGICTAAAGQRGQQAVSDGAGGAIITWMDFRSAVDFDIYVQKVNAAGKTEWGTNGVLICAATGDQLDPQIGSDGAGGAIITWEDYRSGSEYDIHIYAQRVNAHGRVQWTADGVAICTVSSCDAPQVTSDGAGGAIVAWRRGLSYYAQRINASGIVQWTIDGVRLCWELITAYCADPEITSDGAGGAIVVWADGRSGGEELHAQRIDASGLLRWDADGIAVALPPSCNAHQYDFQLICDGAEGAIIVWDEKRCGLIRDVYAQRVDADGYVQWTESGAAVCTADNDQEVPTITSDGAGGAIVTWQDSRSGSADIYAQRIDADGVLQWAAGGIAVCAMIGNQYAPEITSDETGGAIIAWQDNRTGSGNDVYAQKIDAAGSAHWEVGGVAICTATNDQNAPRLISDGARGAVVAWFDKRSGDYDVYAQQINRDGLIGYLSPGIHSVTDVPGDEGGCVNIAWDASRYDPFGAEITTYTIWRALSTPAAMLMLSEGAVLLKGPEQISKASSGPVVRMDIQGNATYYWELIDSHNAYYLEGYSKIVPTALDSSGATSNYYHYFQVIAHTNAPTVFYVSDPDSGYSVDNLAPEMPMSLTGKQMYAPEGLMLVWNPCSEEDLAHYVVYRGLNIDFVPTPENLIASSVDTTTFDGDWRWDIGYFYKVGAVDIHGNESPYALLKPDDVSGDERPEIPAADYLAQNFPNPFNPVTKIEFGLREAGDISLRIYDVAGHLVRVLARGRREAGRYSEIWDGLDGDGSAVAGGIYFCILKAGEFRETKKMVLLK